MLERGGARRHNIVSRGHSCACQEREIFIRSPNEVKSMRRAEIVARSDVKRMCYRDIVRKAAKDLGNSGHVQTPDLMMFRFSRSNEPNVTRSGCNVLIGHETI
jgi:hypothetical protein